MRNVRRGAGGLTLSLMALVFLDVYGLIPMDFIRTLVYVQFLPSVMAYLTGGTGLITGFVFVLILTVLAGRVYCSFLCPLGSMMDAAVFFRKKRYAYAKPSEWFRYPVLVLTILVFISGSVVLVDLLDPYSVFGRIMTVCLRPVVILMNNGAARVLELAGFYALSPRSFLRMSWAVCALTWIWLFLVVLLAVKRGRLYCNTLCPVGSFLGLIARFQVFRLNITESSCNGCGLCARNCKSQCVDLSTKTIDSSRCVMCFNCFTLCPAGSVGFSMCGVNTPDARRVGLRPPQEGGRNPALRNAVSHVPDLCSSKPEADDSRRKTLRMLGLFILGFPGTLKAQVMRPLVYARNRIPVRKKHPVTPPGSLSIGHFTSACTACYLCVTRCPGKVLEPGFTVYGKAGVLMPHLSNRQGFCNFECTVCGEVCPTFAIRSLSKEDKKRVQVGRVHFIRENCIVITQKTECGACSEHCPTKAVNMAVENGLRVPVVNPDLCVGCGACEYACPSLPHKSIYVDGNPEHRKAVKPKTEKISEPSATEDFPF